MNSSLQIGDLSGGLDPRLPFLVFEMGSLRGH